MYLRNYLYDTYIQGVLGEICLTSAGHFCVKLHGHNQTYLYPKLYSCGDNDERKFKEWEQF